VEGVLAKLFKLSEIDMKYFGYGRNPGGAQWKSPGRICCASMDKFPGEMPTHTRVKEKQDYRFLVSADLGSVPSGATDGCVSLNKSLHLPSLQIRPPQTADKASHYSSTAESD
jgi:hypothetical protein